MNHDDDLRRALEVWAETTDPDADPIEAADIRRRPVAHRLRSGRRWTAAVAAMLVVGGFAAGLLFLTSRTDDTRVRTGGPTTTSPTADERTVPAPTTDVAIAAHHLPMGEEGTIHRWALIVDGDTVRSGRLGSDDVVLAAEDLARTVDSTVEVWWEQYVCEGSCPATGLDGRPFDDRVSATAPPCRAAIPDGPVVVVDLGAESLGAEARCEARAVDALPPLTVPPGWSLRDPIGEECGADPTAGLPDPLYPGAPSPGRAPRRCVVDTWETGGSVELSTVLGDGRPVVVRVDDGEVTLVRPPRGGSDWTTETCTGLTHLDRPPWIEATGCGPEEPMPLDP